MQLVCGYILVLRVPQPRDTGMRAFSRSSGVAGKRDGGSEDGLARSTRRVVGKSLMCHVICARDMDLNQVRTASCIDSQGWLIVPLSQIPLSHHLHLIIFLDICLFVRHLEMPYYRLDPWILSSHPHNTIIPLAFTTSSRIQHKTLEKNEDTSLC